MNKIKIGIICPSEIAIRRFMPALKKHENFEYVGVAYPSIDDWCNASAENLQNEKEKAEVFKTTYGGEIYEGYLTIINDPTIEALYIPLPPALHYKWAKLALEKGKHVFVEKPSTTNENDTLSLINFAKEQDLALHENYMFQYHAQIDVIENLIEKNEVGDIRFIKTNFGFPKRSENDFRYNKALGGGALLDCGGYPIRLISKLLGENVKIDGAKLIYNENGIDMYGAVQLSNDNIVGQVAFGMDNSYKCDIEIWGNEGTITTGRVFTAPDGLKTQINVNKGNELNVIDVEADDSFLKSINKFYECIVNKEIRDLEYKDLQTQIKLISEVQKKGV